MADYSTLLRDRVTLAVRSVDRVFLQGYVPHLQTRHRRGQMFSSRSSGRGAIADHALMSERSRVEAGELFSY
jgi:hypothetical protein